MNFFIVNSPLQLLNAIEASVQYNCENSTLILLEGVSSKNLNQLINFSKKWKWNHTYVFRSQIPGLSRFRIIRSLNKIIRDENGICERVFIGEYRSGIMRHFANSIKAKERVVLDDGNVALRIQYQYRNGIDIRSTLSNQWKRYLIHIGSKLFGTLEKDLSSVNFFSVYSSENHNDVKFNSYSYLASMLESKENDNTVFFLGNCTPEVDVVSDEYYMKCLLEVHKYYNGKRVIYIPHRREDKSKLESIKKNFGFEILEFSEPIEWTLIGLEKLPSEIASFITSALDSCYYIFNKKISFVSFIMKSDEIANRDREEIMACYDQYSKYTNNFRLINM